MYKKNLLCFLILLQCNPLLSSAIPTASCVEPSSTTPFFSSKLTTSTYFGQDLDILNIQPFNPYSLFQYIFDFGIKSLNKNLRKEAKQSFSFVANARMKGIFGTIGSGLVPIQQTKKFEIWMKELFLQYMPTENKNNFIKGGLFPFMVGNGFVLGNAYDINIPISWQYCYEQINQFRPGLQLQLGNKKNSISASAYVGFILVQNIISAPSTFSASELLAAEALLHVNSPSLIGGSHNVVTSLQMNFGPFEPYHLKISPYICLHSTDQYIEFPDDATSKLYTPGAVFLYENNKWRINFEVAKNFGHQHVKALDRYVIGTTTHSFKNALNRFRNSYTNSYAGFLVYFNTVWTKKQWRWATAAAYASGENSPNDSPITLFLTKLTPGVRYKDYNKTYKGFLGTNQFSEANSINASYFGPGSYRYSNFALLGSTLAYTIKKEQDTFINHVTWASYFKPNGIILDITDQTGVALNTPLPHYLGTEFNGSTSYSLGNDFKISLLGGFFFPGKNYNELKKQISFAELQIEKSINPAVTSIPTLSPTKVAFFTSFSLVWTFDSLNIKEFFDRNR